MRRRERTQIRVTSRHLSRATGLIRLSRMPPAHLCLSRQRLLTFINQSRQCGRPLRRSWINGRLISSSSTRVSYKNSTRAPVQRASAHAPSPPAAPRPPSAVANCTGSSVRPLLFSCLNIAEV
ncbi:hypothetical protein EVAR_92505_1 [Eumeta japonica]|uniref:Uncharacterized protein n=1 Tax=Eumeta variegata TaxID=151549 RepID=A0A4C1T6Z8_EUMVA|nr:hypothetical protein EVAR_92505_1 [Eumeta japonica]